jgi:hypothetical protein
VNKEHMIRIRVFAPFADSATCKKNYENIFQTALLDNYGPDKKYYITIGDDYTHVIILNTAMPVLKSDIPRTNVIGLAYEPLPFLNLTHAFIQYAMANINTYYISDAYGLPYPFIEGNAYLWYNPPPKLISTKTNLMSIMVSFKQFAPGHIYRHTLVKEILRRNLPIDIYGNGCDLYRINDPRLKGKFELNEPYETYRFHIAIENFQTNSYFSEKIINPLLHKTIPLYLGARNINRYFSNMYIALKGDVEKDIEIITEVLKYPEQYRMLYTPNPEHVEKTMNLFKNKNIDNMYNMNDVDMSTM